MTDLLPRFSTANERFLRALRTAAELHAGQARKSTDIPYLSHLMGTCAIALDHGATEDEAIAALLHDVLEDVDGPRAKERVAEFGPEVLRIVKACSDTEIRPKPAWEVRKRAYVAKLPSEDASILLVSAADKLHNARAILSDLRANGPSVWSRFNAGMHGQLWYYRALVTAYRRAKSHPQALVDELDQVVTAIEAIAQAPLSAEETGS
jgi:(p)ppGpp synthase/HD superfamily hydrolase